MARISFIKPRNRGLSQCPLDRDELVLINREDLYSLAASMALNNVSYFRACWSGGYGPRFAKICKEISQVLISSEPDLKLLIASVHLFDFDPNVPGNGYRTLLAVMDTCLLHIVHLLRRIINERTSLMFKSLYYAQELEAYSKVQATLAAGFRHCQQLLSQTQPGELFPINEGLLRRTMVDIEQIDQKCFYGRTLGFQYCPSMFRPLQLVGVSLAGFSDGFQQLPDQPGIYRAAVSFLASGKYVISPEQRAQRLVSVIRGANIQFFKTFYGVLETRLIQQYQQSMSGCQSMAVNELIKVPFDGVYRLDTNSKDLAGATRTVEIDPPGPCGQSVTCHLLSYVRRRGMKRSTPLLPPLDGGVSATNAIEPSSHLLLHCHGGGFVAQSPKVHEQYLRLWAKELNVPILSVDYSLSPEHPYPRALNEVVYVYAWALHHKSLLGWTGEKVVLIGDSAGGCIITAALLKLASMNVARMPDGVVPIYPALVIRYIPSPSRFMSLMDPLIPLGVVARCMAASSGENEVPSQNGLDLNDTSPSSIDSLGENSASPPSEKRPVFRLDISPPDSPSALNNSPNFPLMKSPSDSTLTGQLSDSMESLDSVLATSLLPETISIAQMGTVEVKKDAAKICISCGAYDKDFINLLKNMDCSQESEDSDDEDNNNFVNVEVSRPVVRNGRRSVSECVDLSYVASSGTASFGCLEEMVPPCETPDNLSPNSGMRHSISFGETLSSVTSYFVYGLSGVLQSAAENQFAAAVDRVMAANKGNTVEGSKDGDQARSSCDLSRFQHMNIPKDPFISPFYAPDELLVRLPPFHMIACHLDPLLDDSVMFARRLRAAGVPVELELIDSLPHGFLNFTGLSQDCLVASKFCTKSIRKAFGMPSAE